LLSLFDDGIVVLRSSLEFVVNRKSIGVALRVRLGEEAAHDLMDYVADQRESWRNDLMTICTERVDVHLERFALKDDVVNGLAAIRREMSDLRVELLRWSFAFWIGQVVAMAGLMAVFLRLLGQ
jgi:hypothetical protein